MSGRKIPAGEKWCRTCKRSKPLDAFYSPPPGYRVNICFACAVENMKRWARTSLSDFDANTVKEASE